MKNQNQEKEIKIGYKNLTWQLKLAVVASYILLAIWILGFLYGFFIGLSAAV